MDSGIAQALVTMSKYENQNCNEAISQYVYLILEYLKKTNFHTKILYFKAYLQHYVKIQITVVQLLLLEEEK